MTEDETKQPPEANSFIAEVGKLAARFCWPLRTFERGDEVVCVAQLANDPEFERFVWIYDTDRVMLRCMLVGKNKVVPGQRAVFFELCARVNEALPFGCLEYSFDEDILVFRDSTDLDWGPMDALVEGSTARVLNLAESYAAAIANVLKGVSPKDAIAGADV